MFFYIIFLWLTLLLVYEGGHRVPLLAWWPLGTSPVLYGTNFDLPVSQVDFFATFADILGRGGSFVRF